MTAAGFARDVCLPAVLLLAGCATPTVDTALRGEPALVEIEAAFVEAVARAHADPDVTWYSGWTGNAFVNADTETRRGLCYEWQQLAWDAAQPAAERVGWCADGIAINTGTWSAHYAVVVWDPVRVARAALLEQPPTAPAFVLDAWRHGEPEVYTVADWIDIPILVMTPPLLEDLTVQYGRPPR